MEKSTWVWGRKGKRSPKEEVTPPETDLLAVKLIQVPGKAGGDDHRLGNGEGKREGNLILVTASRYSSVSWEVSGEPDYPPRKFNKYASIDEVYKATRPPMIINNNKPRMKSKPPTNVGKNSKRAKRMKKRKANEEEESKVLTGNINFIEVENLEEAEMEACPTRNPKFRSTAELYGVTQRATASVMHKN